MKKQTLYNIATKVILVLAILIPLAVAFLVCRYTYKRHIGTYMSTYYTNIKYDKKGNDLEDYSAQVNAYLQYITYDYKLLTTKEVKYDNDNTLATLDVFETIKQSPIYDTEGEISSYSYYISYYFVVYNINYNSVYKLSEGKSTSEITSSTAIPQLYIQIRNNDDFDSTYDATSYELNSFEDVIIKDYGYTPSKVSTQLVQMYELNSSKLPSESITISLHCDENVTTNENEIPDEAKCRYVFDQTSPLALESNYVDITEEEMATFTVGFNSDPLAAGYTKYLFKTYWWWEGLVCIVFVGVLTGLFYLVLTYREEEE